MHKTNDNTCRLRRMGIIIDRLLGRLLSRLSTPPVTIGDKEQLLFSELLQTRKVKVRLGVVVFLPSVERGSQTTSVGDVLAQCQPSVHMKDLAVRTSNVKVRILVNKALSSFFECIDGLIVPPVSIVSSLIVVSTGGIEGYVTLVNQEV